MDDDSYNDIFQSGVWKFYNRNLTVARAQKQGTLYMMHAKLCKSEVDVAADSAREIWHKRLGHMSDKEPTRNFFQK